MKRVWLFVNVVSPLFIFYWFIIAPLVRAQVVAGEMTEAVRIEEVDMSKVGKAVAAYLGLDGPGTFRLHTQTGKPPCLLITSATDYVVRVDFTNLPHTHVP